MLQPATGSGAPISQTLCASKGWGQNDPHDNVQINCRNIIYIVFGTYIKSNDMQELMPELMSECLPQSMSGNYLRRFTRSDVRGYVKIPRMYVKIYVE